MTILLLAVLAFTAREAWLDLGGEWIGLGTGIITATRGFIIGKLWVAVQPRGAWSPSCPVLHICWGPMEGVPPWQIPFRWARTFTLSWPVKIDLYRERGWTLLPGNGRIIGLRIEYGWPLGWMRHIHVFRLPTLGRPRL